MLQFILNDFDFNISTLFMISDYLYAHVKFMCLLQENLVTTNLFRKDSVLTGFYYQGSCRPRPFRYNRVPEISSIISRACYNQSVLMGLSCKGPADLVHSDCGSLITEFIIKGILVYLMRFDWPVFLQVG